MGEHFAKPKADADGLTAAAGKMRTAAGGFSQASTGIRTTSAQALDAPWGGPSTVGFVSASSNLQTLATHGGTDVNTAATATTSYARVVHDVCTGIDTLNRRYDTALTEAQTAATNAPPNSPTDPYAAFNALVPVLQKEYEGLMRRFTSAAKTYVGALASTSGTDPGTIIKASMHPERAALTAVAKCMGPGALGLYYLASGGNGVRGIGGKFGNYYSWLTNGFKAKVTNFLSKSKSLNWLFDLKDATVRYSAASAESWSQFLKGTDELSKPAAKLLSVLRFPEGAVNALSKAKGLMGKAFMPITAISGAVDMITGGGDTGAHGVATRVMGGLGFGGGAVMTAVMLGAPIPGVGEVIAGGAVLAYGAYSLGNFVYKNREAIWHGIKSGAQWVGHTASNVYHAVSDTVSSTVSSVSHAVTHPLDTLGSIF